MFIISIFYIETFNASRLYICTHENHFFSINFFPYIINKQIAEFSSPLLLDTHKHVLYYIARRPSLCQYYNITCYVTLNGHLSHDSHDSKSQ